MNPVHPKRWTLRSVLPIIVPVVTFLAAVVSAIWAASSDRAKFESRVTTVEKATGDQETRLRHAEAILPEIRTDVQWIRAFLMSGSPHGQESNPRDSRGSAHQEAPTPSP